MSNGYPAHNFLRPDNRNHQVAKPKSDLITSRANASPFVSLES
jgi:hypothetical protein